MSGGKKDGIPRFVKYFGPILTSIEMHSGMARPDQVREDVARELDLPPELTTKRLRSGLYQYNNDINQARYFLAAGGCLGPSDKGYWTLTGIGRYGLTPEEALALYRRVYAQRRDARKGKRQGPFQDEKGHRGTATDTPAVPRDPMLVAIHEMSPEVFENLCQRLLFKVGFEKVTVTGVTRDKGIDGLAVTNIKNFLRFQLLFQCKRYFGSVSASEVRDFRGAMQGRADRGLIISTGTFTREAKAEGLREGVPPIEFVDGEELVELIADYRLDLLPDIDMMTGKFMYNEDY